MLVNTNTLISITEANQNFSKAARLADEHGSAVILKNNVPRYLLIDLSRSQEVVAADDDVRAVSERLIRRNMQAYGELAK